jgi:tRNA threonylcarbamoyl adenosine modification protein (Sua5/YciO/YrdC/YwlC family)
MDAPAAEVLERAAAALRRGRLLIYPTETLYAVGGRAMDPHAAAHVREAKGREAGKPLPLIAADPAQARALCEGWPDAAAWLARRFWPGPLTLVLPAGHGVPADVRAEGDTVAVRVPGRELPRRLCQAVGPLISTSANRSGEPPATRCSDAVSAVGPWVELALDGGTCDGAPSTIVDVTGHVPRILREGAIARAEVLAALG